MTRCGTIVLVGRPNVGKSTLLNPLFGARLAIVSPKPQSTRLPVVGQLRKDEAQHIVTDSPGLEPEYQITGARRAPSPETRECFELLDAPTPQFLRRGRN